MEVRFAAALLVALAASPAVAAPDGEPAPAAAAQPTPPAALAAEPEYLGILYRVAPADGSLQALERQTYQVTAKAKAMGFGGARMTYEVPGPASAVRFPASEPARFVIRMASLPADPAGALLLVPLEAGGQGGKKKAKGAAQVRQAVWMDQKGMFADASVDPTMGALPLLAKTVGESSLQIEPAQPLRPGEYAVLLQSSMTAFCFGLD